MKAAYILLLPLLFLFNSAHAAIYKWEDANGNIFYSENPPPEEQVEQLKIRENAPGTEEVAEEEAAPEAKPEQKKDPSQMTFEETKKDNCKRATAYQKSLQGSLSSGSILGVEDADGKMKKLDKAEQEAELERMKGIVDTYCDKSGS